MMRSFLLDLGRFFVVLLGAAVVGGLLRSANPDLVVPIGGLTLLVSIIALYRSIPLGWLRHRSAVSALLIGALGMMWSMGDIASDNSAQTALASGTASKAGPATRVNASKESLSKGSRRKKRFAAKSGSSPLKDPPKQAVWIEVAKDSVRGRLKDPDNARFRNVVFHAFHGKTPIVCGEVNGRNGFGGYSGYQGFIASGRKLVMLGSDFAAGEFAKAWNKACRG